MYAKVTATNVEGPSAESTEGNGATILTYPDPPVALVNNVATTSATETALSWSTGASDGGTPIIDYRISYSAVGAGVFNTLAAGIQTTTYSTTFPQGSEYTYRVESRNAYGYSTSFSNQVTILQAQVPDTPLLFANDPAITDASNIGLTWTPGSFDGASTLLDYRITYD